MSVNAHRELWGFPPWLVIATGILLSAKSYFAMSLDLFGDGAWYWLEATNLAFAYSDLPPATALSIRAGVALLGDNPFGVRFWFLLIGVLPPLITYRWARELGSPWAAGWAAAVALSIPMIATLGVLALPDVLLITVGLAACCAFERATRSEQLGLTPWLVTGLLVGAGFVVHYRFAIVPLGMAAYMFAAPRGRALLATRAPWLAALTALPGLAPIAWFNLTNDYHGLEFQFVSRHPWTFDAGGLSFWSDQWLATTPLLYPLLLIAAVAALRSRSEVNDRPFLLAVIGLTHLLVYGLASPYMDHQRTNIHWPLLGYLTLAILLPQCCAKLFGSRANLALGSATAITGVAALGLFASIALMTEYERLERDVRAPLVSKLSGHSDVARAVAARRMEPGQPIVTGQYYVAAQLRFALGRDAPVYVLPEEKAARDGRAPQLAAWRMLFTDLANDRDALLVIERTAWSDDEYDALLSAVCARYSAVAPIDTFMQFEGERLFRFFSLTGGGSAPLPRRQHPSATCRPASKIYVDRGYPRAFDHVAGSLTAEGWAFQDDGGIDRIELLVNGEVHAEANYGLPRPDVGAFFSDSNDPNHPHVGFRAAWGTHGLAPGTHEVSLRVTSKNGNIETHSVRPFRVAHPDR